MPIFNKDYQTISALLISGEQQRQQQAIWQSTSTPKNKFTQKSSSKRGIWATCDFDTDDHLKVC